ncbi:hypothetical protein Hanom_Chr10g00896171 [Helianthus anomalus]
MNDPFHLNLNVTGALPLNLNGDGSFHLNLNNDGPLHQFERQCEQWGNGQPSPLHLNLNHAILLIS